MLRPLGDSDGTTLRAAMLNVENGVPVLHIYGTTIEGGGPRFSLVCAAVNEGSV